MKIKETMKQFLAHNETKCDFEISVQLFILYKNMFFLSGRKLPLLAI